MRGDEFRRAVMKKLVQDLEQIGRCAGLLSEAQAWSRPNEHCNSAANLILHLTGNVRQWIVAGLGGATFERDRPGEFAARDAGPHAPIYAELERVVQAALRVIGSLDDAGLERRYSIQGYDVSGLEACFHVAEHFSFHTGQIVHMTKAILDVDLSLFDAQGRRMQSSAQPW